MAYNKYPNFLHSILVVLSVLYFHTILGRALELPSAENLPKLKAARSIGSLTKRHKDIYLTNSADLIFRDFEGSTGFGNNFYANLRVTSNDPFLFLEEIEHLLHSVQCIDSIVELNFIVPPSTTTSNVLDSLVGQYLITSHQGCNSDGDRSPYFVEALSSSTDGTSYRLQATKKDWHETSLKVSLACGQTDDTHSPHDPYHLRRRQAASSTSTEEFQIPTSLIPTTSQTATSPGTFNLANKLVGALSPGTSLHGSVKCNNCGSTGSLTFPTINVDLLELSPTFIIDAEFDFSMTAEIEIDLTTDPQRLKLPFFAGPAAFFSIGGTINGGVATYIYLDLELTLKQPLAFTFGIDVKLPKSKIHLDGVHISNSSVTGLDGFTIKTTPFQANSSDVEFTSRITIRPEIDAVFSLGLTTAGAGLFLTPNIQVDVSQRGSSTVDSKCNAGGALEASLQSIFPNLTAVIPTAGVGLGAQGKVLLDTFSTMLLTTSIPLPTQCLAFRKDGVAKGDPFTTADNAVKNPKGGVGRVEARLFGFAGGKFAMSWDVCVGAVSILGLFLVAIL